MSRKGASTDEPRGPARQPPISRHEGTAACDLEEVRSCPLCGSQRLVRLFEARDTLHGRPGVWGVLECGGCRLMVTSPRPTKAAMAEFYPDDYQPHAAHFAPAAHKRSALHRSVRRLLDPKEVVIPASRVPGRLLEIGCGSGRTLVELADRGWEVHGLEPSAAAVATLRAHRDLPVSVGTIEAAEFPSESFDLIVATMVLEHLHDPVADVAKLRGWLRPGGFLTGSVPNCASWEFRVFKGEWFALQVPTHLFHFTPATLTALLDRAGFHRVRIFQQRNVNNLMIHLGRFLSRHHLPLSATCLEFPERGSRGLRLAVRPLASVLAWLRQAGRITFLAESR